MKSSQLAVTDARNAELLSAHPSQLNAEPLASKPCLKKKKLKMILSKSSLF